MTHFLLTSILLILVWGNPEAPPASKTPETAISAPQDTLSPAAFVMSLQVYEVGIIRKGATWAADGATKLKEMNQKNAEHWRQATIDGSLEAGVKTVEIAEGTLK